MVQRITIIFVALATVFALVHVFAVATSLYWYYWWFDIVMHFCGGILLGLGIHSFSTFSWSPVKVTTRNVFSILVLVTVSWEIFERLNGLYNSVGYIADMTQDLCLGIGGGLLAHLVLRTYRMR